MGINHRYKLKFSIDDTPVFKGKSDNDKDLDKMFDTIKYKLRGKK